MSGDIPNEAAPDGPANPDRRAALATMGMYAGVTAPAVVALLTADASEAWATSGKTGPKRPGQPSRGRSRR
ncbi:MAG: hypothetical protein QM699_13575 [Amaricoccus sp.]|uniref:hypothetical protein n=1 Tax=Amaricoccus sp. TaxID=1872485 RepID=UPI0039E225BF